ncbi:MAG TPA: AI-2E family transporter [Bacteroidota bacterium]|nr:AI-2E family transporter [Bacteroidota bacterium]
MAKSVVLNRWILLGALAALLLLMILVPSVIRLVVVALLLAYICDPMVTAIELRGLTRTSATLVFFAIVFSIIYLLVLLLSPVVVSQVETLRAGASDKQTAAVILQLQSLIRNKLGFLGLGDIKLDVKIREFGTSIGARILDFIVNEGLTIVIDAVTIPFMVFFFLKDGREMKKGLISIVPNRYFEFTLDLLYKMDGQLGNYLRSQFTDAVAFGVLSTIALWILGVKYFIFIGAFAGIANLIPYVGPIAGALPGVIVALFETGDLSKALQVIAAFAILKMTDDFLIQPLLVAKGVHLHPLLVLLAIFVGQELFGMLGMLLAVPATGFVKVVIQESIVTLRKYRFTG